MGGRGQSLGISPEQRRLSESMKELKEVRKALNYTNSENARNAESEAEGKVREAQRAVEQAEGKKTGKVSTPQKITEFVYTQVGLDLTQHMTGTTRRFGGGVIVDWKGMSRVQQNRLMQAIQAGRGEYRIESWSGWQKLIRKRLSNEPF